MTSTVVPTRPQKGLPMEGVIASWYARTRRDPEAARDIERVAALAPPDGDVLEVAPGPGHVAIALAQRGYRVTGLDISASFLRIAHARARAAATTVTWVLGDAAELPFPDATYDVVLCRAAFKNFTAPARAIEQMYRVLRPGGTAVILDLCGSARRADVEAYVHTMGLGRLDAALTRRSLGGFLLKNAYTPEAMRDLVAQTPFAGTDAEITVAGIALEVLLRRPGTR